MFYTCTYIHTHSHIHTYAHTHTLTHKNPCMQALAGSSSSRTASASPAQMNSLSKTFSFRTKLEHDRFRPKSARVTSRCFLLAQHQPTEGKSQTNKHSRMRSTRWKRIVFWKLQKWSIWNQVQQQDLGFFYFYLTWVRGILLLFYIWTLKALTFSFACCKNAKANVI